MLPMKEIETGMLFQVKNQRRVGVSHREVNDNDVVDYCDNEPFNLSIVGELDGAIDSVAWAQNDTK